MLHKPRTFSASTYYYPLFLSQNRGSEMKNMDVLTSSGVFVLVVAVTLGLARAGSWAVMKLAEQNSNKFTL